MVNGDSMRNVWCISCTVHSIYIQATSTYQYLAFKLANKIWCVLSYLMFTPVVAHPNLLDALKVADARGKELDIGGALVILLSHGGIIGIHLQGGEGE